MSKKRVELSVHTNMSEKSGVNSAVDFIEMAIDNEMPAIAITDCCSVQALPQALLRADRGRGIKLICGMELFYKTEEGVFRMSLLAKNKQGLKDLYRLLSSAYTQHPQDVPLITFEEVEKYRENLLTGISLRDELLHAILAGKDDAELEKIISFYDYVCLHPLGCFRDLILQGKIKNEAELVEINKRVIALSEKNGKKIVATGDVYYLTSDFEEIRQILISQVGKEAANQPDAYFRTTEEMLEEFAFLGEEKAYETVVENTCYIADLIENIEYEYGSWPTIEKSTCNVKTCAESKAKEIYGSNLPDIVTERLSWEINAICKYGVAEVYLIAMHIAKVAKDRGDVISTRGSVASSFVAFLLGITEINPLPPHYICPNCHYTEFYEDEFCGADMENKCCPKCGKMLKKDGFNIPGEMFIGVDGDKVPDIDFNFTPELWDAVFKKLEEVFGKDKVIRAGMIGTLSASEAEEMYDNYCKQKNISHSDLRKKQIISSLVKVKISTGAHPSGVIILPEDKEIYDYTPVQYADGDDSCLSTHIDYQSLFTLSKFDISTQYDLSLLRRLELCTGLSSREIPLDDTKTLDLFKSGNTCGVPVFCTDFVKKLIRITDVNSFDDLIRLFALPFGAGAWSDNAEDILRNEEAALSDVISCRDDVMIYLLKMG